MVMVLLNSSHSESYSESFFHSVLSVPMCFSPSIIFLVTKNIVIKQFLSMFDYCLWDFLPSC